MFAAVILKKSKHTIVQHFIMVPIEAEQEEQEKIQSQFFAAAREGNVKQLKHLVGQGRKVPVLEVFWNITNLSCLESQALLHIRVSLYFFKMFGEFPPDINSTDDQGNTALHLVAFRFDT